MKLVKSLLFANVKCYWPRSQTRKSLLFANVKLRILGDITTITDRPDYRVSLQTNYPPPQGGVIDAPFSFSAAEARFKVYLKEMGADGGETLHGFRSGCVMTLALSGVELSEIMDHDGWS